MTGTNDGISLPITKSAFASHNLRTLFNAGSIGNLTPSKVPVITLTLLLLTAEMAMQSATTPFVRIDVQIDAFMADSGLFGEFQIAGDLLWTPLLAQEPLYLLPRLPGNAGTVCLALSIESELICLIRTITLQPPVAA